MAGIEARLHLRAGGRVPAVCGIRPCPQAEKAALADAFVTYQHEYGSDSLEIHKDGVTPGQRVLLCDDLLATGGTAAATINLIRELGGEVVGAAFAVELSFLKGREKLAGVDVFSLLKYDK